MLVGFVPDQPAQPIEALPLTSRQTVKAVLGPSGASRQNGLRAGRGQGWPVLPRSLLGSASLGPILSVDGLSVVSHLRASRWAGGRLTACIRICGVPSRMLRVKWCVFPQGRVLGGAVVPRFRLDPAFWSYDDPAVLLGLCAGVSGAQVESPGGGCAARRSLVSPVQCWGAGGRRAEFCC